MSRWLSSHRIRVVHQSLTSSRLIYILLVDTALTFVLFTFLYHHHFTSLSHASTVVNLCRSLRTTSSNGVPVPFQTICHDSSTILNAPSTVMQQFLLVTKEMVLGTGSLEAGDYVEVRTARNWKVLKFVVAKMGLVGVLFGWFNRHTTMEGTEKTGTIKLSTEEGGEVKGGSEIRVVVESTVPPPTYTPSKSFRFGSVEDEDRDEDEVCWILLALSLIGHLSIVLVDQGALDNLRNSRFLQDKWIVFGLASFSIGMIGIWREWSMQRRKSRDESLVIVEAEAFGDEKKGMVIIEL